MGIQDFLRALIDSFVIDNAKPRGFIPQADIGCNRQVWGEVELLIDHLDAEGSGLCRSAKGNRFTQPAYITCIRRLQTGDGLKERGFSRTVFTEQGDDLALPDTEVDALQRLDGAAERFFDALEGQPVCHSGRLLRSRT